MKLPRCNFLGPLCIVLALAWLIVGCSPKVATRRTLYTPKSDSPPPILHCFDGVGHIVGSKPFLLGGTCVCTPTQAVLDDYQKHGYFEGLSLDDLIKMYEARGIKTALDHQGCNNMCQWGPHVLKGGQCMVPPTPGTTNYEQILSGDFPKPPAVKKSKKTSSPSPQP